MSRKIAIRTPTYDRKIGNKFFIYFFCFIFIIVLLSLTLITDSSFGIESYEFEDKWNTSCEATPDEWACNPSYIIQDGVFRNPTGIAVDNNGNVYIADSWNDRIQKFTSDGHFITKWGTRGSGDGQFRSPTGIAVDNLGNVYVADFSNDRIQKFTSDGHFITKWGTRGSGDGQFQFPTGIAVDNDGNVYIADSWNDRIQKFTSDGHFITKIESIELDDGKKTLEEMFDLKVTGMKILVSDSRTDALEIFSILS